jgi:hypothetical protein
VCLGNINILYCYYCILFDNCFKDFYLHCVIIYLLLGSYKQRVYTICLQLISYNSNAIEYYSTKLIASNYTKLIIIYCVPLASAHIFFPIENVQTHNGRRIANRHCLSNYIHLNKTI